MSGNVASSDQVIQPQITELSLPGKIVGTAITTGIGMSVGYGFASALMYPFQLVGSIKPVTRINQSALVALAIPIEPVVTYCANSLLGSSNSELVNITKEVTVGATILLLASTASNYLGYENNSFTLITSRVAFISINRLLPLVMDYLIPIEDDLLDESKIEDLSEEIQTLDSNRVKLFEKTSAEKTEQVKKLVLTAA